MTTITLMMANTVVMIIAKRST